MMLSDENNDDLSNALGNDDSGEERNGSDDEDDMELAVDIITSVQLGSGARVTCLATWCGNAIAEENEMESIDKGKNGEQRMVKENEKGSSKPRDNPKAEVQMDGKTVEKARALVSKAKKIQAKKK